MIKTKFIRTNGSGYKIGLSVAHPAVLLMISWDLNTTSRTNFEWVVDYANIRYSC